MSRFQAFSDTEHSAQQTVRQEQLSYLEDGQPGLTVDIQSLKALSDRVMPLLQFLNRSTQKLQGNYRSLFKAQGMEFAEVRPYQAGDDIRSIDWRVTARTGQAHTKLFQEEKEQQLTLLVDQSLNQLFGSKRCFKSVLIAEIAALLSAQAIQQHHRVGLLVFTSIALHFEPPRSSGNRLLQCYEQLVRNNQAAFKYFSEKHLSPRKIQSQPSLKQAEPITLKDAIERALKHLNPGTVLLLISDINSLSELPATLLKQLARYTKLDVIGVYDLLELTLPDSGHYRVTDGEEVAHFSTQNKRISEAYSAQFKEKLKALQTLFDNLGVLFSIRGTHEISDISLLAACENQQLGRQSVNTLLHPA